MSSNPTTCNNNRSRTTTTMIDQWMRILLPVDSSLLYCFQVGIGLGIIIITTLSFFPGEPLGIIYGNHEDEVLKKILEQHQQQKVNNDPVADSATCDKTSPSIDSAIEHHDPLVNDGREATTEQQPNSKAEDHKNASSTLEDIPPSTLEQIQKRYQWNEEQMQRVLETYRQQKREQQQQPPVQGGWTPHQKLNSAVYAIMISVMVYVLNQEYGNYFSVLVAQFFPREAKLLGLTLTIEESTSSER